MGGRWWENEERAISLSSFVAFAFCDLCVKKALGSLHADRDQLLHRRYVQNTVGCGSCAVNGRIHVDGAEDFLFAAGGEDAELGFAGANENFAVGDER